MWGEMSIKLELEKIHAREQAEKAERLAALEKMKSESRDRADRFISAFEEEAEFLKSLNFIWKKLAKENEITIWNKSIQIDISCGEKNIHMSAGVRKHSPNGGITYTADVKSIPEAQKIIASWIAIAHKD